MLRGDSIILASQTFAPNDMPDVSLNPTISVITATRNVESTISRLYVSLNKQSRGPFEWVVIDGLSTDRTVDLLKKFAKDSTWVKFISEPDFGFYHAINKAVTMAKGQYYVVAGADDEFEPNALAAYAKQAKENAADIILARIIRAGREIGGFYPYKGWISPAKVFAGSHSVGMLIKKDLHERFGLYSKRFPLLADSYFLKCLLKSGSVRFEVADFIAGTFAEGGLTSINKLQILAETWQIQMLTERRPFLQTLLFLGKILMRWPALTDELSNRRSLR